MAHTPFCDPPHSIESGVDFEKRIQAIYDTCRTQEAIAQRQQIFDVDDEIIERRNALISELQKRLRQVTSTDLLFRVRWSVI